MPDILKKILRRGTMGNRPRGSFGDDSQGDNNDNNNSQNTSDNAARSTRQHVKGKRTLGPSMGSGAGSNQSSRSGSGRGWRRRSVPNLPDGVVIQVQRKSDSQGLVVTSKKDDLLTWSLAGILPTTEDLLEEIGISSSSSQRNAILQSISPEQLAEERGESTTAPTDGGGTDNDDDELDDEDQAMIEEAAMVMTGHMYGSSVSTMRSSNTVRRLRRKPLPQALEEWLESILMLVQSDELANLANTSINVAWSAGDLTVRVFLLPVSLPLHITTNSVKLVLCASVNVMTATGVLPLPPSQPDEDGEQEQQDSNVVVDFVHGVFRLPGFFLGVAVRMVAPVLGIGDDDEFDTEEPPATLMSRRRQDRLCKNEEERSALQNRLRLDFTHADAVDKQTSASNNEPQSVATSETSKNDNPATDKGNNKDNDDKKSTQSVLSNRRSGPNKFGGIRIPQIADRRFVRFGKPALNNAPSSSKSTDNFQSVPASTILQERPEASKTTTPSITDTAPRGQRELTTSPSTVTSPSPSPSPKEGRSDFLMRVEDFDLTECVSPEEDGTPSPKLAFIDLKPENADPVLVQRTLNRMVPVGLALFSNHPTVRLRTVSPTSEGEDKQREIIWKAEASTARLLREMVIMSTLERLKTLETQTLLWSGKYAAEEANKTPFFLARGIVRSSPLEFMHLLWDNTRTSEYNNFCLGRKTLFVQGYPNAGDHNDPVIVDGVTNCTKVIRSETRVPFTGLTVVATCMMHVRHLELPNEGYVIVTRSLHPGTTKSKDGRDKRGPQQDHSQQVSEIIWGINVLRRVPNHPHLTDLTSLSQVSTSMVPQFLAQRIGVMGVEDFFKNARNPKKGTKSYPN